MEKNDAPRWQRRLRLIIILLTVLVAVYGVLSFIVARIECKKMSQFLVEKYIEHTVLSGFRLTQT